ncbi:MAG: DUF6879 family protein [Pseudonocardia sp.]
MDLEELRRISGDAKISAFRLETLPQYLVPQEEASFAAWQGGRPVPRRTPENSELLARLQQQIARGFRRYRVHILDQPLTPYLRFELYLYLDSVAVGSEVYVVDRDAHADLADLHEDFWIFDDEIAVRMYYDGEGRFLHPELIEDIEPYRELRDMTMSRSEPVTEYLARNGLTRESLRMTG